MSDQTRRLRDPRALSAVVVAGLRTAAAALLLLLVLLTRQAFQEWAFYRSAGSGPFDGGPAEDHVQTALAFLLGLITGAALFWCAVTWVAWQVTAVRNGIALGYARSLLKRLAGVWAAVVVATTAAFVAARHGASHYVDEVADVPPHGLAIGDGLIPVSTLTSGAVIVTVLAAVLLVEVTVHRWTREQNLLVQPPPQPQQVSATAD